MKCIHCNAWTDVVETRSLDDSVVHRRRECANGHRFNTNEVPLSMVADARDLRSAKNRIAQRREQWERNLRICRDSRSASVVAKEHGLTDARVRQIRAESLQRRTVQRAARINPQLRK